MDIMGIVRNHWYEILTTIFSLGLVAKYIRIRMIAGDFINWLHIRQEAASNGSISDSEWVLIGKAADLFAMNLWSVIKGLFPNKSKVVT